MKLNKNKILSLFALCIAIPSMVNADEYQWFNEINYAKIEVDEFNFNRSVYSFGTQYYFTPQKTLGPMDQFSFIQKSDKLGFNYADTESSNIFALSGELYSGNFHFAASYQKEDIQSDHYDGENKDTRLTFGYLFSDNLLLDLNLGKSSFDNNNDSRVSNTNNSVSLSLKHNYQLNGKDYIGSQLSIFEDDAFSLSNKYFKQLNNGKYLVLTSQILSRKSIDNLYSLGVDYYTNLTTSFGASISNQNTYTVRAQHYFNHNTAISFKIFKNDEDAKVDIINISLNSNW